MKNIGVVEEIKLIKEKNQFRNYIEYIVFPFYRNLEMNSKIVFDFPLVAFVGKNGSGKTSALQALYGTVKDKTVGDYWFSTEVDPIKEDGNRNCYYYAYKDTYNSEKLCEVLMTRIMKENNPDYWETSRPVKKYGMNMYISPKSGSKTRNSPVEKECLYLDFKSELSAFDKCFNIGRQDRGLMRNYSKIQDYIRSKSRDLISAINERKVIYTTGVQQNYPLYDFTSQQIHDINYILGKNYTNGVIIKHKIYKYWGISVIFKTESFDYSEAHAGSGEAKIASLVYYIDQMKDNSLILVDEPEISIHPGAQYRLTQYLLQKVKAKKLQVIISTHSKDIISILPKESIKVFSPIVNDRFKIVENIYPLEAFYFIETKIDSKISIVVEDICACKIISAILNKNPEMKAVIDVQYNPGGAETIIQDISVFSKSKQNNVFVILDGYKDYSLSYSEVAATTEQQNETNLSNEYLLDNPHILENVIKDLTGQSVKFNIDGNKGMKKRDDQRIKLQKEYIQFFREHVFYLPEMIPEDIIWDADAPFISRLDFDKISDINRLTDSKSKIYRAYEYTGVSDYNFLLQTLIENWISKDTSNKDKIVETLKLIVEKSC